MAEGQHTISYPTSDQERLSGDQGMPTHEVSARESPGGDDWSQTAWKDDLTCMGMACQRQIERAIHGVEYPGRLMNQEDRSSPRIPRHFGCIRPAGQMIIQADQECIAEWGVESMTVVIQQLDS
jgi:hypothetical protein